MTRKIHAVAGVVRCVVDGLGAGEANDVKNAESQRDGDRHRPQCGQLAEATATLRTDERVVRHDLSPRVEWLKVVANRVAPYASRGWQSPARAQAFLTSRERKG